MFYISARKWGNTVLHRWIDDSGRDRTEEDEFKPILYMEDNSASDSFDRISMIGGIGLSAIRYETVKDFSAAVNSYARSGVIYGQNNVELQYLSTRFNRAVSFDISKIRLCCLDIEVFAGDGRPTPELATKEVTAITHYDSIEDRYFVFSIVPWESAKSELSKEILERIVFKHVGTERELLAAWLGLWNSKCPAVVTGWSTNRFDLPYLYNRIEKIFGTARCKTLSPFGVVRKSESIDKYGEPQIDIDIYGVNCLDYHNLYKKFTVKPRESHKLGYIAYVELGEKKIDYSEEGSINDLQQKNPQKYIDYNITDVVLVLRLDKKIQLLPLAYYIAYTSKINLEDVYSPVKTWDALVFNYLDSIGKCPKIVVPSGSKVKYEGAYVKPPLVGSWESVVSFDVASLYPSIIRQWNMCPSTIDEKNSLPYGRYVEEMLSRELVMENGEFCLSANGVAFRRDIPGIFPILVEQLFNDRKTAKSQAKSLQKEAEFAKANGDLEGYERLKFEASGADAKQGAIKVLLNSLYGACGNIYFRYFDLRIAEGITRSGQVAIRWIERDMNDFISKVSGSNRDRCLAIDTDSVFFTLHDLVLKSFGGMPTIEKQIDFMDKSCKLLEEKVIRPSFKSLFEYTRCVSPAIEMKREALANKAFWMAAKVYALDVYDMEGVRYAEPDLISKGLSLVKSETPEFCREALKKGIKIILRGTEDDRIIKFIEETWEGFRKLRPEEMAKTTTANDIDKWLAPPGSGRLCNKGTPQQCRAVIVFNDLLIRKGLQKKYERFKPGEKAKIVQLMKPNPAGSGVIGFPLLLPDELGLSEYVDAQAMFELGFLNALQEVCNVLKVKTKEIVTLEDFFS